MQFHKLFEQIMLVGIEAFLGALMLFTLWFMLNLLLNPPE